MFKRVMLALLAIIVLNGIVMVGDALADNNKVSRKAHKKDYKVWYFAGLPVDYFILQIPFHEGTHAMAAGISSNYDVFKFQPYPHYTPDGSVFYVGSVSFSCHGTACDDKVGLGVISAAPYIMDTAVFATADLLLSTKVVNATSVAGRILYFAGMVVPWWDLSFNAVWANDISDAAHIATNLDIPRWSVMAVGMSVSAVGVWRLWHGYKRAFRTQSNGHTGDSNLVVVPMSDAGTLGASVRGRF